DTEGNQRIEEKRAAADVWSAAAPFFQQKRRPQKGPPQQRGKTSGKPEKGLTERSQPWYNKMLSCPCEKMPNSPTVQEQFSIQDEKRQEA
ncbi:MAG: hypothetical protein KH028_08810, partial [Oscillospiraceae bacterium]|nr:hypothetical protein [Oscillospiraceae bacterium]